MVPITSLLPFLFAFSFLSEAQLVVNGSEFVLMEYIDSESFPLDLDGALVSLSYFLSLNESDANTAPTVLYLFLDTWTAADNAMWAINSTAYKQQNSSTIPWAMSRLAGIISAQAYQELCSEYHLANFCPTEGCYVPNLVFFNQEDAQTVANLFTSNTLNITVLSFLPNAWKWFCVTNPFIIFYSTFFAIFFAVPVIAGGYFLFLLIQKSKGKLKINFAFVCIVLEIMSNILRVVLVIDDPFTFKVILSVETLHVPFGIIIGILLIFIWQDITRRKTNTQRHPFLSDKFRYPAVVLCIFIAVLELVALIYPISLGQNFNNVFYYLIYTTVYVLCYVILAVFYFVTSARVFKLLKTMKNVANAPSSERKENDTRQLTYKVITSGVGMVLTCAGALGLVFNDVPTNMFGFTSWYLGLGITSISTVFAFSPRRNGDKSSTGSLQKHTSSGKVDEVEVEEDGRSSQ